MRRGDLRKRIMKKDPKLALQVRLAAVLWLYSAVCMCMSLLSLQALCGTVAKDLNTAGQELFHVPGGVH